jgi:hypothetical protein
MLFFSSLILWICRACVWVLKGWQICVVGGEFACVLGLWHIPYVRLFFLSDRVEKCIVRIDCLALQKMQIQTNVSMGSVGRISALLNVFVQWWLSIFFCMVKWIFFMIFSMIFFLVLSPRRSDSDRNTTGVFYCPHHASWYVSVCLPVCLPACLSVCLSVYLTFTFAYYPSWCTDCQLRFTRHHGLGCPL